MVFALKSIEISTEYLLYREVPSYRHTTCLHFYYTTFPTQFSPIILSLNPTNITIHINHNVDDIHCTTIIIMDG